MNLLKRKARELLTRAGGGIGGGAMIMHTELIARKIVDGKYTDVRRVVKDRVVTDDFAELIVDTLVANDDGIKDFKYHDSGTGTDAEAAGDSGLGTPWGGARSVGSQEEGATTKTYKSIATTTYNAGFAITEHGLFNAAADGVLMDRTKFDAINVVDTNQIEWTFQISFASGG